MRMVLRVKVNKAFYKYGLITNGGEIALLGRSDPIDERLKSKVAAKEAEQNAYFNKVVTARTNLPVLLTGVAEELCKKQSDYAENFKLNPPSSPKEGN